MPRFFTDNINETEGSIFGDDAKHISKVLRMRMGDSLIVCDMNGMDYHCTITQMDEKQVDLSVEKVSQSTGEPTVKISLYQALPKADKMELIIQKAVELGVAEVIPVQTHRCVSRPDSKTMEKKRERYNRIAQEAAKQCGRGKIPQVRSLLDFRQAVEEISQGERGLLFYENSNSSLKEAITKPFKQISILIGAEGGFEDDEVNLAREKGLEILSLGSRILRCETAPLAALATILYQTGNL